MWSGRPRPLNAGGKEESREQITSNADPLIRICSWLGLAGGAHAPHNPSYFRFPAAPLQLRFTAICAPIIWTTGDGKIQINFERTGRPLDLQSLARPDRGLRRMVRPTAPRLLSLNRLQRPHMVGCVLCAGLPVQLSALHGDDLPRLPSR